MKFGYFRRDFGQAEDDTLRALVARDGVGTEHPQLFPFVFCRDDPSAANRDVARRRVLGTQAAAARLVRTVLSFCRSRGCLDLLCCSDPPGLYRSC